MSNAAVDPPSQSSASQTTVPTKPPPHGQPHPRSPEPPRQRRRLDPEDDETVVATPAASSQTRAAAELPKDNRNRRDDDIGSEYTASESSTEDSDEAPAPVPVKRSRGPGSARLKMKAVAARGSSEMLKPHTGKSRSRTPGPVSEAPAASRGSRGSLSRSVMVCVPKRVTPGKRRASESKVPAVTQKKPAHRTPSPLEAIKHIREYHRISARSPQQRAAGSLPASAPASAGRVLLTHPKPQVTGAGSVKPAPDDGSSAAVKQFLAGIGLGASHVQVLLQEGIRTQQDLDGLRQMEKDSIAELGDVLRARGFTAFQFSKVEYAISRKKD